MKNLDILRKEIDEIDSALLKLLEKRMQCAKEVGLYKKQNNLPVLNQNRENEILENVLRQNDEFGIYLKKIYSCLLSASKELQNNIISKLN